MVDQFRMSMSSALKTLPGPDPEDANYNILFVRGTAELLVYAPKGVDNQEIHDRDEFYFIVSGKGKFFDGHSTLDFSSGDALFVAAGVEHRFVDFTDDLSMWVLFYGPLGGEKSK
ncbi:cupin domain-containing protein [Aestuariivirga sp.]|uniref:cupin domain-containing protein n=1 Tax=Aestuariivirga sp. TaxID=2650926 RepID=UPI003BAA0D09